MNVADLDIIIKTITEGYMPERIYLFGSALKNGSEKCNDVDLLLIKKTDEPFYKRPLSVQKLFNPYVYDLDIHVYTPDEFDASKNYINTIAYIVNKNGRLIYEA